MKYHVALAAKLTLVVLILVMVISGCTQEEPVKIAVMTKLEAGSLVGVSEVDAVKYYLEKHGIDSIEFIPFDDGWDPAKIPEVYKEIRAQGIDIIITSHTSTCALELKQFTDAEADDVLVLITGSTTDQLTGLDDNNLRLIQDVSMEQRSIADRILEENFDNLVVLRDIDNDKYTDPAIAYFVEQYGQNVPVFDISVGQMDMGAIENFLRTNEFDAVYTLIGGNHTASGAIAQVAWTINPEVRVFFTPWNNSPTILNTAGPAIDQCTMSSHYPAKADSPQTEAYLNGFTENYNYAPTYNSLHVYRAVDIVSQAILAGHKTPSELKAWMIKTKHFETELGGVTFDENGDTSLGLYFIEDIVKEYQ